MSSNRLGHWTTATIAEVGRARMGKTILKKDLTGAGIPVYSAGRENTPWGFLASSDVMFGPGAIVVSARGNIGFPRIPKQAPFVSTQTTISIELQDSSLAPFIRYALELVDWGRMTSQTTIPMITVRQVMGLEVALPPLSELRRITDALDSFFTRLDDAEATLQRVERNLERYRASVLQAAVEGRLVPTEAELASCESRDNEPGAALLARVLAERRRRWEQAEQAKLNTRGKTTAPEKLIAKYPEPIQPDVSRLHKLPDGWCWTTLGQLVWSVKDGPHFSPKYSEEGIPFITGGHVRPHGVDFDSAKRISLDLHSRFSERVHPAVGDILYTKGGTTGIARVNTYNQEFSVWVHVAVLKLAGIVEPFYVQHALNSPWCYAQAQRHTHGVGNQDLGLTRMVRITIPLPPIREQQRIVEEVGRLESMINNLVNQVESARARLERVRQAILNQAFAGRLVDQDASDEPASVLLNRIRAERAKAAVSPETPGRRGRRCKAVKK